MSESAAEPGVGDRLRWLVELLVPTGLAVGLLFYFGYVTTEAWLRWFGLDVALVGLSQQAIVLQSVAALYLPLGALVLGGLVVVGLRRGALAVLRRGRHLVHLRRLALGSAVTGVALLGRAAVGVLVPDVSRREPLAASALCLCAGTLACAGGFDVLRRRRARPSGWVGIAVGAAVVLGLFWATNSVAAAYGTGRAQAFAAGLASRPAVVLDARERLFLGSAAVRETQLSVPPKSEGPRYRYRGLRVLISAEDRIYLISADWRHGAGTVVGVDPGTVRIQVQR